MSVSAPFYIDIWLGILHLQRKTRMVARLHGFEAGETSPSLGYTDGLVLLLLEAKPGQTVKDISQSLKLEQSWASRVVAGLEKRKLLRAVTPETDRRSKMLHLTKKGEGALEELTTSRREITNHALKDLTAKERDELRQHLESLADGLGAPNYLTRQGSHPVDVQMARLSWAIGVIGNDYMESGMNVTQYQLLALLAEHSKRATSSAGLYRHLPFDMSTISRTMALFEERGLLERRSSSHDGRSLDLVLTSRGLSTWKENLRTAARVFGAALSDLSETKLQHFAELLQKASAQMPERTRVLLHNHIEMQRAHSPASVESVEDFLVENQKQRSSSEGQEYYALFKENQLCGAAVVQRLLDGQIGAVRFSAINLSEAACVKFFRSCLKSQKH